MALIRFVSMLIWALVFIVLLLFAIKNSQIVTLRFYFDRAWDAPLIVILLGTFAGGTIFGLAACVPSLVRQRREVARLKKEIKLREKGAVSSQTAAPPPPLPIPDVPSTL